jgi:hypothetical protein
MDLTFLINSMVTGLFVGVGSAFGTWLVTRYFIQHLEKLEDKLKNGNDKKN